MRLFEATLWVAAVVAWNLAGPINWGVVEANDPATCKKLAVAMAKQNGAAYEPCTLMNVSTFERIKKLPGVMWQHDLFPYHGFTPARKVP